jgi:hypothetical protein
MIHHTVGQDCMTPSGRSIRKLTRRSDGLPPLQFIAFVAFSLLGLSLAGCGRVMSGDIDRRADAGACGETRMQTAVYEADAENATDADINTLNSDFKLLVRVKSALVGDTGLEALPIDVGVLRGVITLYGKVDTPAQRARAAQIAWNVPGVRAVKSGIAVTRCS